MEGHNPKLLNGASSLLILAGINFNEAGDIPLLNYAQPRRGKS
jgi:hypothetical protein